jgi:hypothetical protein
MLLDVTGILFAAQLVLLLTIGPYADYGTWRPWIMISEFQSELRSADLVAYGVLHSCPNNPLHLPVCHVRYKQARPVASRPGAIRRRFARSVSSSLSLSLCPYFWETNDRNSSNFTLCMPHRGTLLTS